MLLVLAGAPRSAEAACPGDSCLTAALDERGNLDFFATGGSFTLDDDDDDRPDAVLEEGRVVVPASAIPPRATLRRAWLYFGGSLYADGDGRTFDTSVELSVPGAPEAFSSVEGDVRFESGAIDLFPELTLYTVRADVTEVVRSAGGQMAGTYRVRGFDADIFDGPLEHTAANASFSLVLLYDEPRLPPREVVLFEGLEIVLGSTMTLDLSGFTVSRVPSGALTVYALEGDCHPGPGSCAAGDNASGLERILVTGADGARSLTVSDDVNPPNDVFNRTINTVEPALTGVVGTDIDRFDISSVLRPGDDAVTVEVTAPAPSGGNRGELVGLAYVVVGIDVFAPELAVDTRIEVSSSAGDVLDAFFPGDVLQARLAVSNTGNTAARAVSAELDLPADVTGFELLPLPGTATASVDPRGGPAGRGRIEVQGLEVRQGEVAAVPLRLETRCPRFEPGVLTLTATVTGDGIPAFVTTTTAAIAASESCGPRFELRGGGGCRGPARAPAGWVLGLAVAAWAWRRGGRRRGSGALLVLFGLGALACGDERADDRSPPEPLGTPCPGQLGMVVVPSVRGQDPFCIDQYEARVSVGELGNPIQPEGGDGSTTALAVSERFRAPTRGVTWHQAAAVCRASGKRLCTADEWQTACGGEDDRTYPYGDTFEPGRCNGDAAGRGDAVETGAMIEAVVTPDDRRIADGCVSAFGVYDLSGNLWEWNASLVIGETQRGLAGGSYRSNAAGLRCVTEDAGEEPDRAEPSYGFRCCADVP